MGSIMLLMFLVLIGVHVLLNWMYYFIIAIPLIASATFFIAGWAITLYSPFLELEARIIMESINLLFGFLGVSISTSIIDPIFKFIDRVGLFFIAVSSIFWWLVKKGETIKYKALAFYLVFFVFIGALLGIGNLTNLFFVLFIWYLLFLKVQGLEDIEDIGKFVPLFKIGATIMILSSIGGLNLLGFGISSTPIFFNNSNDIYDNFISIYPKILGLLLIIGVWKPTLFTHYIPKLNDFIEFLKSKGQHLIKWL